MNKICPVALGLCLILPAAGCSTTSQYGVQQVQVQYYPMCYDPIQKLRTEEQDVSKSTATGGLMGALAGAIVGYAATGRWEGAVAGGVAGGALGAMAANIFTEKQQIQDQNQRMFSYLQDLNGDISNLDIVAASARTSLQCYDTKFNELIKAYKQKKITKDQLQAQYAEIRSGVQEVSALLGDHILRGRDLERAYAEALNKEEQTFAAARQSTPANLRQAKDNAYKLGQKANDIEKEKQKAEQMTIVQSEQVHQLLLATTA